MAQNWRRGWQNFEILRAKIENMISPDCVLCYLPRTNENLGKIENFWKILENFGFFLLQISNYNFKSRRQIMTARGVYFTIMSYVSWHFFMLWCPFNKNRNLITGWASKGWLQTPAELNMKIGQICHTYKTLAFYQSCCMHEFQQLYPIKNSYSLLSRA